MTKPASSVEHQTLQADTIANPGATRAIADWSKQPSGERYLYQLFSLIDAADFTVVNPAEQEFRVVLFI